MASDSGLMPVAMEKRRCDRVLPLHWNLCTGGTAFEGNTDPGSAAVLVDIAGRGVDCSTIGEESWEWTDSVGGATIGVVVVTSSSRLDFGGLLLHMSLLAAVRIGEEVALK